MTYAIHKFTDGTKSYIGYETMEDYNYKDTNDTRAALFKKRPDLVNLIFNYQQLRLEVEEAELWKSLRGFMDAYNSVEEGYNTKEEYEMVSAQIIKQNLKAATQNQVDLSEDQTYTISLQDEGNIVPNPNLSTPIESVVSLTKSDLISLAAEHGFSSDTIVLYLYLNTIPGNQFTDAILKQAAKDLDLTDDTIKTSYDILVEDNLIEEFRTFQVKKV